jgi:nucleoside-diphosphate-sugar epimerase
MSDPILITGATGFIGRVLVERLSADGGPAERLRCLVRDLPRALRLGLPEPSLLQGDLADPAALARAAQGCTAVVHLAGLTRSLREADLFAANEAGTGQVAAQVAAVAPGARFVHVSSLAAAGPSIDGRVSAASPEACRPCSNYGRSKLGGEVRLLEHAPRLDWCVIRPGIVYGPGDEGTRLLFRQATAALAVVPWRRRPLSLIHVDDLVDALLTALGACGVQGYFPVEGPERVDTDSLVGRIAGACGRSPRRLPMPMLVPRLVAPLADLVSRLRGEASFLNADKMREASAVGWVADPGPARDRLGFDPRVRVDEGLADTLQRDPWLRDRFRSAGP